MTEQWKPIGDKWPQPAMVMVSADHGGTVAIAGPSALNDYGVPKYCLHPMPPTITPEQQAVLDAAVEQEKEQSIGSGKKWETYHATNVAVFAMLAAQQPPDPVKELREAWNDVQHGLHDHKWAARMEAAIAAMEKKT